MNLITSISFISFAVLGSNARELGLCLKCIAERYFNEKYIVFIYWKGPEWERKKLLYATPSEPRAPGRISYRWCRQDISEDGIIKVFSEEERWTVKIYKGDAAGDAKVRADHRTRHVVFIVDSDIVTTLQKFISELKLGKKITGWRAQGQILILVRERGGVDGVKTGKFVLEALWSFTKSCNAVFLVAGEGKGIALYKSVPYADECEKIGRVDEIDVWENGSFSDKGELFRSRGFRDLNGCPLKVGAFPNPPYVLLPEGNRTNFKSGLDIKIIESLSVIFNFTVRYVTLPEGKFPYVIFDSDGKASGFHGMLERQELDVMIFGCRIHELRNMLAEPLDSYAEDALVWVVPTPNLVPSWRNIGDAFTPTVWLLFGVFFLLITFTLYLIANFHQEETSSLRTFVSCVLSSLGVILNNSVPQPRSTLLRFFMFMFALYAINTNSAYQSSLIALLTNARYEKPYETPMDAVMGGVKTYLFPSGNITYNQTDHDMWNIIFQPGRHAFIEDFVPVLREIAMDKTAMVMMAQNVAGFEIRTKYMTQDNTPRALFLKEKFSLYKVTAYVSSGHPLRQQFRKKVNQMVEGGLVEYWLKQVLLMSHHRYLSKQEEDGIQALGLRHLQGPFYILLIALLVSFQVFCFELGCQRVCRNLKSRPF